MTAASSEEAEAPHKGLSLNETPSGRLDPALARAIAGRAESSVGRQLHRGDEVLQLLVDGAVGRQLVVREVLPSSTDKLGVLELPLVDAEVGR